MLFFGLLFMVVGAFAVLAAVKDWDWFMGSAKARILSGLIGRKGARVFYIVLGLVLIFYAIWGFILPSI